MIVHDCHNVVMWEVPIKTDIPYEYLIMNDDFND